MKNKRNHIKKPTKTINHEVSFFEKPWLLVLIILVVTFIAFLPTLKNGFMTTWDDNVYVTENMAIRHLDMASIKAMFSTPINGTYVPLPLLSFAAEYFFFGLNPFPYHFTNLILHLICTLLVFHFLRLLKLDHIYAAFGALLFGIHPMHVESVAWITERKDLLYSLFYLGSIIFYIRYFQTLKKKWKFIILSLICFILSLFSKIQAVTLPFSLLLIDYLLERPFKFRLVVEKIPFFALSLIFGISGILILNSQGTFDVSQGYNFLQGIFLGLYALSAYILKFFIPFQLSALYPVPVSSSVQPLPLLYYLNPLSLLLIGFVIYRSARYTRAIVFGFLFFFINVVFLLQIVPVGNAFVADRFSYVAYLGLIFITGWFLQETIRNKRKIRYALSTTISIFVILFITLTFNRCKIWENGEIFWTDVIEKYPTESSIPYSNRSVAYNEQGQWERTISDCTKAIGINPKDVNAYSNRSIAFGNQGEFNNAISDCSMAIGINPNFANAYSNRGNAYLGLKEWDKAIADFSNAIRINPNDGNAYSNRGVAYGNKGDWEKAIDGYTKAIEIDPLNAKAYSNRGSVYVNLKVFDKAVADYSSAIMLNPRYANAYFNRGVVYMESGELDKAIADFSKALEINPDFRIAYANREFALKKLMESRKQ